MVEVAEADDMAEDQEADEAQADQVVVLQAEEEAEEVATKDHHLVAE